MELGKRLLWLVIGSCLAGLAFSAFLANDDSLCRQLVVWCTAVGPCSIDITGAPSHTCAGGCSLAWIALSYFQLRRQQWARWLAAVALTVVAVLLLANVFMSYVDGVMSNQLQLINPTLLLGSVFAVDAGILTFSERIGDFFAGGPGMGHADWGAARASNAAREPVRRAEILAGLPGQKAMLRRSRRFTVTAVALAWIIATGLIGWQTQQYIRFVHESKQRLEADRQAAIQEGHGHIGDAAGWGFTMRGAFDAWAQSLDLFALVLGSYVGVFMMPSLLALPLVFRFAQRWRRPIRFLVLRPFNNDHTTKELSHLLRDAFAPFGHCYTLSDRNVRVPFHIRVPLLFGQLSFFNYRVRKIRRPQHIEKIARGMRRRLRRNINWLLSATKLFPISCCDDGWRACVGRLVDEVDVVVVDVSKLSANVLWELE